MTKTKTKTKPQNLRDMLIDMLKVKTKNEEFTPLELICASMCMNATQTTADGARDRATLVQLIGVDDMRELLKKTAPSFIDQPATAGSIEDNQPQEPKDHE